MTKKEIISLSLKLAGIYCLIMSINYLSMTFSTVVHAWRRGFLQILSPISGVVLLLLFGIYLIFSNKLLTKIDSSMTQEEKTSCFTFQDIQVLAFSIIGVWLVSSAIPNFVAGVVQIIVRHSTSQQSDHVVTYGYSILNAGLTIVLGIYLFSGGKGLTRLWKKFHSTMGMKGSD